MSLYAFEIDTYPMSARGQCVSTLCYQRHHLVKFRRYEFTYNACKDTVYPMGFFCFVCSAFIECKERPIGEAFTVDYVTVRPFHDATRLAVTCICSLTLYSDMVRIRFCVGLGGAYLDLFKSRVHCLGKWGMASLNFPNSVRWVFSCASKRDDSC